MQEVRYGALNVNARARLRPGASPGRGLGRAFSPTLPLSTREYNWLLRINLRASSPAEGLKKSNRTSLLHILCIARGCYTKQRLVQILETAQQNCDSSCTKPSVNAALLYRANMLKKFHSSMSQ